MIIANLLQDDTEAKRANIITNDVVKGVVEALGCVMEGKVGGRERREKRVRE
jgi:hypothetical protein